MTRRMTAYAAACSEEAALSAPLPALRAYLRKRLAPAHTDAEMTASLRERADDLTAKARLAAAFPAYAARLRAGAAIRLRFAERLSPPDGGLPR